MKGISPLFGIILIVTFSLIAASISVFLLTSLPTLPRIPEKEAFPQVPKTVEITAEKVAMCSQVSIKIEEVKSSRIIALNPSPVDVTDVRLILDGTEIIPPNTTLPAEGVRTYSIVRGTNTSVVIRGLCLGEVPVEGKCSIGDYCWKEAETLLKLTIPSYTIALGSHIDLPISIINAEKIAGGTVKVLFNNSVLNVVDVKAGDFGTPIYNLKNEEGFVKIAVASATASGKSEAVLAIITVEVIGKGVSQLSLVEAELNDEKGNLITPQVVHGVLSTVS